MNSGVDFAAGGVVLLQKKILLVKNKIAVIILTTIQMLLLPRCIVNMGLYKTAIPPNIQTLSDSLFLCKPLAKNNAQTQTTNLERK